MRRVVVLAGCSVLLAACGIVGGSSKTTTTTTTAPTIPATTTSTVPQAAVEVRPPSGPVGTTFKLLVTRFQSGEGVTFEIDFPNAKAPFKGTRVHKAGPDGSVTDATYLVTSNNPVGTYTVKAAGDKGTQATSQFEVTAGGATATTVPGRTTTTGRTATTKATTTTTKKP